jgi:hypothetical protein
MRTLSGAHLKARLDEAYLIAQNPKATVPTTWEHRSRKLDECATKTFIPALGAALLAKATDDQVDALSLKARGSSPGAYSIRGPVKVLSQHQAQYGIYLGGLGPEPLNNNNWNQRERIDQISGARDQAWVSVLVSWLNELNKLDADKALLALAAFLRDRIAKQTQLAASATVNVSGSAFGMTDLATAVETVIAPVDGGRLGQAAVAAALEAAGHSVRSRRVNDPAPFDVRTLADDGSTLMGGEVKQKPVGEAEALELAERCAADGCDKAVMFDLASNQSPLNRTSLAEDADKDHGVELRCVESVAELLEFAVFSSDKKRADFLGDFPQAFADQMLAAKVADEHRKAWKALCDARQP